MNNLEYARKKLELILSKSKMKIMNSDKKYFMYLPKIVEENNKYYFKFPIFEQVDSGIRLVEDKLYNIAENRLEKSNVYEERFIFHDNSLKTPNEEVLLGVVTDIFWNAKIKKDYKSHIEKYINEFNNSILNKNYQIMYNEEKEYSVQEILERINSIEKLEQLEYDFDWNLDTGLRYISDEMIDIIIAILEKGSLKISFDEDKKIKIENTIKNLCTNELTMQDLKEKLEKNEISNLPASFSSSSERYKDYVCLGCKFDRCPKFYAGYVLYLKNKKMLEEKLKDREQYRQNVMKSNYFSFTWDTESGLKNIPENVYKFSEQLVENGYIIVNPSLTEKNYVKINSLYGCSDLKISNYDIKRLSNKFERTYSNWTNIVRSNKKLLKFCTNFTCRLDSCPIVVAGYIYYLKRSGLEKQIAEDRKYYNEHLNEINKENVEEKRNKLEELDNAKNKYKEELKNKFEDKLENIDKLIDNIHNSSQKNLHIVLRGNNNKAKKECEEHIKLLLESIGKVGETEIISLQNFASMRANFRDGINYSTKYNNISQGKLYIINNIKEFINDYKLYKNLNTLTYNEIRKKQFDYAIEILTDMSCPNYILLDATEKELDDLFELDQKLKFVFQDNIYDIKNLSLDNMFDVYSKSLKPDLLDKLREKEKTVRKKFIEYVSLNSEFVPFSREELANYIALYSNNKNDLVFPPNVYKKETVEESLKNIVGMESVKENVKKFEKYALFTVQAKNLGLNLQKSNMHMIFTGNPGTGKTTIARIMAKMLYDLGLIKENKLIEVERKDLVAGYIGQTAIKTGEVLDKAMGGVLFVDEAYSLASGLKNDFGSEAISTIIKTMEDRKDDIVVIFAGYKDEMKSFLDINPGISSRIGYTFDFPDYTSSELTQIFNKKMTNMGFVIDANVDSKVQDICEYFSKRKAFGNGRFIDKLIQETIMKHATAQDSEINKININDIPTITEINNTQVSSYIAGEMLNNLVGMEELKEKVKEFEEYLIFEKEAENHKLSLPTQNKHMIFTGNPGTGKTTVARIIAKILFDLEIIHENKLVEVERKDLIASYVGQTAPKTSEVIEKAIGGVLFIDEAYTLASKSQNDFGSEAIATLIKAMEDYKGEFIVIFAGYKNEMRTFLDSNPGIASRIGYTFDFPDYTSDEYCEIFSRKVLQTGMKLEEKALPEIKSLMNYFCNIENIGNGRFVDKVFQETLMKHSKNKSKKIEVIHKEDIPTIKEMTKTIFNGNNMIDVDNITDEAQERTAIHEIGHATLRYLLNKKTGIKKITINAEGTGTLGYVRYSLENESYTSSKSKLLNNIVICLGGMASEQVFLGEFENGNTSDLAKATDIANRMITQYGMSSLGFAQITNTSGEIAVLVQNEINKILDDCFKKAVELITENKKKMENAVKYLMQNKEIDETQFIEHFEEKNKKVSKDTKPMKKNKKS